MGDKILYKLTVINEYVSGVTGFLEDQVPELGIALKHEGNSKYFEVNSKKPISPEILQAVNSMAGATIEKIIAQNPEANSTSH